MNEEKVLDAYAYISRADVIRLHNSLLSSSSSLSLLFICYSFTISIQSHARTSPHIQHLIYTIYTIKYTEIA